MFWSNLQSLVRESTIVVDRPKGSVHPKYPDFVYPYDYGFLKGTMAADGDGIDCWLGSLNTESVTGIIVIVDLLEKDSEIKVLIGCTPEEAAQILEIHQRGMMKGILIERPEGARST